MTEELPRWQDDQHFQDRTIVEVEGKAPADGTPAFWDLTFDDGWSMRVPVVNDVTPVPGMSARLFGKGLGHRVRGILLGGACAFYRTEDEDQEHFETELYGRDGADILTRWDAGKVVHSIEMGGMGPGYEQAIQIAAFEMLRHLVEVKPDASKWDDREAWNGDAKTLEDAVIPALGPLGLTGAQFGAALHLACRFYQRGPRAVMADRATKDRHIVVSRHFPSLGPPPAAQPIPPDEAARVPDLIAKGEQMVRDRRLVTAAPVPPGTSTPTLGGGSR